MYTFILISIIATMALLPTITKIIARFAGQAVNPQKNRQTVQQHALAAEQVFKWVAVIITGVGFFILGKSFALAYDLHPMAANVVGAVACVAAGWITDFSFSHFLEDSIYQFLVFFRGDWKTSTTPRFTQIMQASRWCLVTTMVVLLFMADYYSVVIMKSPVSEASRPATIINIDSVARASTQRTHDAIALINTDIDAVKKAITDKTNATHNAHPELSTLIAKGNRWAPGELKRLVDKSIKPDNERLVALQARKDAEYARQSAITDQATALATNANTSAITYTDGTRAAMSGMFSTFGIGSKVLTILLRIFLVISFLANPHDADGDGHISSKDVSAAAASKSIPRATPPESTTPPIAIAEAPRRPIGFYRDPITDDASVAELLSKSALHSTAAPEMPPMSEITTPVVPVAPVKQVIQPTTYAPVEILQDPTVEKKAGKAWLLASINDWKTYFGIYSRRAVESATEEGRQQNAARAEAYRTMIAAVGFEAVYSPTKKPKVQTTAIPDFNINPEKAKEIITAQLASIREMGPQKSMATT